MDKLFEITFQPSNRKVRVEKGTTIKEAAHRASIHIRGECGGHGRCGKCRIVAIPKKNLPILPQLESENRPILQDTDALSLACQTHVEEPLNVFVMPEPNANEAVQGKTGIKGPYSIDPFVQRFFIGRFSISSAINDSKRDIISSIQEQIHKITGQEICFNA